MSIFVFCAHPADLAVSCGGYLRSLLLAGQACRVVVITHGDLADAGRAASEALSVLAAGSDVSVPLACWGYPAHAVPLHTLMLQRYRDVVGDSEAQTLLLPAPNSADADQRRLTRGVLAALQGIWAGELHFYETSTPLAACNGYVPIDLASKLAALACFQLPASVSRIVRGLALLRGAACGVEAAEGFIRFGWEGEAQNFFEARPLVSVLLRGDDAGALANALQSLCRQPYDHLEVILLWRGDAAVAEQIAAQFATLFLHCLASGDNLGADFARGLQAAQGAYCVCLEQTDLLLPDHLALLLAEFNAFPNSDVVYGNALVRRGEAIHTLALPYRGGDWLHGEGWPLAAVLLKTSLARQVGIAAESGEHAAWHLLARLALRHAQFVHVDELVCECRVAEQIDATAIAAQRAALLGHSDDDVAAHLRQNQVEITQQAAQIAALEARLQQLNSQPCDSAELLRYRRLMRLLNPEQDLPLGVLCSPQPRFAVRISLIVPLYNTPPHLLRELLHSVLLQSYPNWELCLADDASTSAATRAAIKAFLQQHDSDRRVRFVRRKQNGGISRASRDAIALASGDWLTFVDHDDRLPQDALLEIATIIAEQPQLKLIYTDSQNVDPQGQPLWRVHKSSWAPETLLHINYPNHLSVVRRDVFDAAGGMGTDYDGGQDWDVLLRVAQRVQADEVAHIPVALYDWRAVETSVAFSNDSKPWALVAAKRAVVDHLASRGIAVTEQRDAPASAGFVWHWTPPRWSSLCIIIPTHRNAAGLAKLLGALLDHPYPGPHRIIVIANRVRDAATQAVLAGLDPQRVSVNVDDAPFNWAALNNRAVAASSSEALLFLNDDVEMLHADWLEKMVRYLDLPQVGAVGARLYYPGAERLQHDGVITDPHWVADNIGNPGIYAMPRNASAVTGACLLTRRHVFEQCGGFDERFAVAYNDVDYCLQLRGLGWRIVQATDVCLIHAESLTRGNSMKPLQRAQFAKEQQRMRQKWGDALSETLLVRSETLPLGGR